MKKKMSSSIGCLLLASSAAFLAGCGDSSSVSYASTPVTISYFDDAAVPNLVGYSYVKPHSKATEMGHQQAYEDNSFYDYASRSGNPLTAVGNHWVFSGFKGQYPGGGEVDLNDVTADCSVYASFVERSYVYGIAYQNDDNEQAFAETSLAWADQIACPVLASYQQVDYAHASANPNGFWGYDFQNPGDPSKTTPAFYSVLDDTKKALPNLWTFASGVNAPTSPAASGTLYAVTALNDTHLTNPTYPLYLSNGDSWIELGTLASGLTIKLRASYTMVKHSFTVSFYESKPAVGVNPTVLGTLEVPFAEVFTLNADGTNLTASYGGVNEVFASSHMSWEGFYANCEGIKLYDGKTVSDLRVMADCAFYPID